MPDADVDVALEWLEHNPPTSITIPEGVPYVDGRGFDYVQMHFMHSGRRMGKHSALNAEKAPYMFGATLLSAVVWAWDEGVPDDVAEVLGKLCAELPYLGTSESVCVARFGDTPEPTHTQATGGYVVGTVQEEVPSPGRTAELRKLWKSIVPPKYVGNSKNMPDAVRKASEESRDLRQNMASLPYAPVNPEPPLEGAPWDRAVWLPFREGDDPRPVDHVKVAETIHRALVQRVADDAGYCPSILSGKYPEGRPDGVVNNVAVVIVPWRSGAPHAGGNRSGILVLIPSGADVSDGDVVIEAALAYRDRPKSNITALNLKVDTDSAQEIDPTRWWNKPAVGSTRLWSPYPLAISDFPQQAPFAAAHKALKFVMGTPVPKSAVVRAKEADPSLLTSYTHRTTAVEGKDAQGSTYRARVVHPAFNATYRLDGIVPDTAVVAVGQSRHFGVGLLIPYDTSDKSGNPS